MLANHSTQPIDNQFVEQLKATPFAVFERHEFAHQSAAYSRREFYKISLILGTGRLLYAHRGIVIDRPALLFSNPLIPYAWEAISADQDGFFCLFTEEFLRTNGRNVIIQESPLFKLGSDPVFFLDSVHQESIGRLFSQMLSEFASDYVHKFDVLRNQVNLVLHEALKMQPAVHYFTPTHAAERITSLFLKLLERQFPVDSPHYSLRLKTASDYAQHLSVHVNYLNRMVKKITGKTTTELITERIIAEAKALLQHTNWSISEIATSLGYNYPTYFNNLFKKQTGVTPRSLR